MTVFVTYRPRPDRNCVTLNESPSFWAIYRPKHLETFWRMGDPMIPVVPTVHINFFTNHEGAVSTVFLTDCEP